MTTINVQRHLTSLETRMAQEHRQRESLNRIAMYRRPSLWAELATWEFWKEFIAGLACLLLMFGMLFGLMVAI